MAWHAGVIPAPLRQLGSESLNTVDRGQHEQGQGQLCAALCFPSKQLTQLQGRRHLCNIDPVWECSAYLTLASARRDVTVLIRVSKWCCVENTGLGCPPDLDSHTGSCALWLGFQTCKMGIMQRD